MLKKSLPLLMLSATCWAVEPGEHLQPWTLPDQFDQAYTLDNDTQVMLVARDMTGSGIAKQVLQTRPKGELEKKHVVFLADISEMPEVISNLFAVPAMRDYPYRIVLDRQARVTSDYAVPEHQVLWLRLNQRNVTERQTFSDPQALQNALNQLN